MSASCLLLLWAFLAWWRRCCCHIDISGNTKLYRTSRMCGRVVKTRTWAHGSVPAEKSWAKQEVSYHFGMKLPKFPCFDKILCRCLLTKTDATLPIQRNPQNDKGPPSPTWHLIHLAPAVSQNHQIWSVWKPVFWEDMTGRPHSPLRDFCDLSLFQIWKWKFDRTTCEIWQFDHTYLSSM